MGRIRVGLRRSRLTFVDALRMATTGDVIELGEGVHAADSVFVGNLSIVGVGDPRRTVINGQVEIRGNCHISNVTIQAPHFRNGIYMKAAGARLELQDSHVSGDPAQKYPAVYAEGGVVVMRQSLVHTDKKAPGIVVTGDGELHAFSSGIGCLEVSTARAHLTDTTAFTIVCLDRARVDTYGRLTATPAANTRSLLIRGESVCRIAHLQPLDESGEAMCDESFLRIEDAVIPPGGTFSVFTKGQALVESGSDAVRVVGEGESAEPPEPSEPDEPKVVLWRREDARSFGTAVAPHLNKGDTILLEEGEYHLDGYEDGLLLGADLAGKGRADLTVLNGSIGVMDGCDIAISNITLRPDAGRNALTMREGNSLSMTNVVVDCPTGSDVPVLYLAGGTIGMSECDVRAATGDPQTGIVDVDQQAHLTATHSNLGWFRVYGGGTAQLVESRAIQVLAQDAADVSAVEGLDIQENDCSMRGVVVEEGAQARFDRITTGATYFEAYVEAGALAIEQLSMPEDGAAVVQFTGGATVDVDEGRLLLEDLDASPEAETGRRTATPSSPEAAHASAGEQPPTEAESTEPGDTPDDDRDPLADIMSLTGLATVKEQINAFTRMVKFNRLRAERGLKSADMTMHSLFLGNPGTGKTTVARLLRDALFRAGAIERDVFVEAGRRDLVGEHIGESANMTQQVLERARGGVLFIDEAYALYQQNNNEFAQEAVDTLLTFMENHRDEIVVIFAGYPDRMQDFLSMNPGLKSRIPNRFDFEDYSPTEIAGIGYQNLLDADYTVDEDLYRRIVMGAYGRTADKSNGRWVRNFNDELVKRMARRVLDSDEPGPDDLTRITTDDLYGVAGGDPSQRRETTDQLLEQLDDMIGLESVKDWVHRLVNRVKVDQQRMELDGSVSRPTYHMVFAGNPGTGKTTVANIIGRLFHSLGILSSPTVKVVDRTGLVGTWIGHTEERTTRAIDEAMGGVLFVDEAYQLTVEGSSNDFGHQAVETLLTRLENDRDKFVAIFAGYTHEMDRFLDANPGLRSRIPLTIEFPDFTPEQVGEIVVSHLAQRWTFDEAIVMDVAATAYDALADRDRSNGRWARTFTERLEAAQSDYVAAHGITGPAITHIPTEVIRSVSGA